MIFCPIFFPLRPSNKDGSIPSTGKAMVIHLTKLSEKAVLQASSVIFITFLID